VTIFKSGVYQFGHSGGIYSNNVTVTGHTVAVGSGIKTNFYVNSPHTRGKENCTAPFYTSEETDWDYFGQLPPSGNAKWQRGLRRRTGHLHLGTLDLGIRVVSLGEFG
jgi:hypothetical protein